MKILQSSFSATLVTSFLTLHLTWGGVEGTTLGYILPNGATATTVLPSDVALKLVDAMGSAVEHAAEQAHTMWLADPFRYLTTSRWAH